MERGRRERLQSGMKKMLGVMDDMIIILVVGMVSGFKTYQTVYFKYVWFAVHQSYLNNTV